MRLGAYPRLAVLAAAAVGAAAIAPHATTARTSDPGATTETTTASQTTAATDTTTVPAGTSVPSSTTPAVSPCVGAGPVAVVKPGESPQTGGLSLASASPAGAQTAAAKYPEDGSIVTADKLEVGVAGCANESQAPGGTATALTALSLLVGVVRADALKADLVPSDAVDGSGWHFRASVQGLRVRNQELSVAAGAAVPVGDWGLLRGGTRELVEGPLQWCAAALELEVTRAHAGFAAGTKLLVGYACADRPYAVARPELQPAAPRQPVAARKQQRSPRPASKRPASPQHLRHTTRRHRRHARRRVSRPLKATPPLGDRDYVFPVAGQSSFGDSYGVPRSDVSGGWHHGDDIFAPIGRPVVAVANGTLNRVGWERVGGWRLWVRDRLGNEFYYAHLSGYTRAALRSRRVAAGQVLGFIGNTGDAFTTPPHLHFEIHPRTLLRFHYDGAVDPTGYLERWRHVQRARAPRPVHPSFPSGSVRAKAKNVFRELLAARHLSTRPARDAPATRSHLPYADRQLRAAAADAAAFDVRARHPRGRPFSPLTLIATGVSLALLVAWRFGLTVYRRRSEDSA